MKKLSVFLCAMVLAFGVVGTAYAALQTIGTATYMGSDYNLIYEDDSIDGGLVWLDYSNSLTVWQNQVAWASGIGGHLTVNLDPGYTTDIDWSAGWRLPLTQDQTWGYYQTGSEMGHLFYESLGNIAGPDPGGGLTNTGDFDNLYASGWIYMSGTELSPSQAPWGFVFLDGLQGTTTRQYDGHALAVRPGTVSAVPIPSAVWLLGSGLIGLVGFRRKFNKS